MRTFSKEHYEITQDKDFFYLYGKEEIKDNLENTNIKYNIDLIIEEYCEYCGFLINEIKGYKKPIELSTARLVLISSLYDTYKPTYKELGSYFSNRDHSTIIYDIDSAKGLVETRFPKAIHYKKIADKIISKYQLNL